MPNSQRKCKQCKDYFDEWVEYPFGKFCIRDHAVDWVMDMRKKNAEKAKKKRKRAAKAEVKARRKSTKEDKERIKTRSQWLKEAQTAFNAFIRERDKAEPCISCGRHHQGQYHAGHYRSVGAAPELRFCEDNVQKQCAPCNNHLSGNPIEYRIRLLAKIGADRVGWIEGPHEPAKLRVEEIKEIKQKYKDKLKELKKCTERY